MENSLIAVEAKPINGESIPTVNARDLHSFLGNKDRFATWIRDRIQQFGFIENQDFISFSENPEKPQGGRPAKEYALTLDMAKELSMVERTAKGKEARRYFIECERRLRAGETMPRKTPRKKPTPLADRPSPLDAYLQVPYFRVIAGYQSAIRGQRLLGKKGIQASLAAAQITGQAFGVDIQRYLLLDFPVPATKIATVAVDALSVDRTEAGSNHADLAVSTEPVFLSAQELAGKVPVVCSTGQPDAHLINEALITMGYAQRRSDNSAFPRQPQADGLFRMEPVLSQDGRRISGRFFTTWNAERMVPILRQHFSKKPQQLHLIVQS